jgi:hypothetical protein
LFVKVDAICGDCHRELQTALSDSWSFIKHIEQPPCVLVLSVAHKGAQLPAGHLLLLCQQEPCPVEAGSLSLLLLMVFDSSLKRFTSDLAVLCAFVWPLFLHRTPLLERARLAVEKATRWSL